MVLEPVPAHFPSDWLEARLGSAGKQFRALYNQGKGDQAPGRTVIEKVALWTDCPFRLHTTVARKPATVV
jgi:hypothetical protein